MTTIAFKDDIIAYDGMLVDGCGTIQSLTHFKNQEYSGYLIFMSGDVLPASVIVRMLSQKSNDTPSVAEGQAFVITKNTGKMVLISYQDGVINSSLECDTTLSYSIGSGSDHALTAMDMGGSATKAVEMAKLRDVNTGGHVRTYYLKEYLDKDR